MLKGSIVYHVDEQTHYVYNVIGYDSSALALTFTAPKAKARRFMCSSDMTSNTFYDGEDDESRRVDVKLAKVVVQTGKHTEGKKAVKNPVNADLFCQIAAVIRYVKNHCVKRNEKYYTGISLASKEFEAITDMEYNIPLPSDANQLLATCKLHLGCIHELHVNAPTVTIDLVNDSDVEDYLPKIVEGWSTGIKFDKEYLGFEPEQFSQSINLDTNNGMYTCIEDVVAAHPDKEFSWLLGKDYRIVDDEHLEEICKYIMDWDGYVYYDTETTGLNINFKSRVGQADQLVGVVLSVKYGESFFFPVQMKSIKNLCNGDHWYFMEHYMRPILEGKQLVAHNMSYDWKVAYIYDINANIVHDTMALIKLTIGAENKDYPMGLKENAQYLLGRDSLELSDLLVNDEWGESEIKFWDLPYELVRLYACADTDNTNGLLQYAIQSDLLTKYNAKKVYEIEIAFSFAVAYQEFFGHRIDVTNLAIMRKSIGEEQDNCMKQMVDIVGHEFNPNSSQQLQKILLQELGIPEKEMTSRKTGRPTTDKETLKKLAEITNENDEPQYPFCAILQKYREAEGVRKIVDKFPEHVTPDGYVFSSVMQYGTTTGRVSINKPNYQSYNDPIKKNVVPRPGFYMFDTDYSSVEYRVLGNMVGNKKIMESFKDPDFDYHQYQAARMYGVPYATVTKKMRKSAKGINFGLPYGMGDESLGVRIFGEQTPENTKKAAALRASYFKGQEDIRDWFEFHRNKGVNEGFTETYFGRRRYYHKGQFSVGAIRRQAGNQVIQGTAADIYKTAVGRVFKRVCKEGWLGKVLFTGFIHDELLGEVSNEINPGVFLKMLREEFEVKITNDDGTPWCPLYMGFGYGMSWYEAKSVEWPIKMQWEKVAQFGETGFPNWTGNGRAFCDTIPDMLRDFSVRDIRNQLLDADSQGKEIKPTLNNELIACVKEDAEYYTQGIKETCPQMNWEDATMVQQYLSTYKDIVEQYLDQKYHIQNLMIDDNGTYMIQYEPSKKTQECIDLFCKVHATDRTAIDLADIAEANATIDTENIAIEQDAEQSNNTEIMLFKIQQLGSYLDIENGLIYMKYHRNPLLWNELCKSFTPQKSTTEKSYQLVIVESDNDNRMTPTNYYITSERIPFVTNACITAASAI